MRTTGLVSLSIHEALTFGKTDSTETIIALHPDLFSDQSSTKQNVLGRSIGSSTVALQKTQHHRNNSDSLALTFDNGKTEDGRPPIINSGSFPSAPSVSNRQLQVGDMIEIRVWDPLPGSSKSTPPSLMRRSPPASKDTSRVGSGSNSVTNEQPPLRRSSSTSATLELAASTLQLSSAASLQYSIDSVLPTFDKKEEPSQEGDASSASSIEGVKEIVGQTFSPSSLEADTNTVMVTAAGDDNRAGMPPTVPRSRSGTADGSTRLLTSKPPTILRSRTGTGTPGPSKPPGLHVRNMSDMTLETAPENRHTSSTNNLTKSALHVRDVSDMTVETILGSQLIEESGDDGDVDDTLSQIASTHTLRLSFVMLVTESTLTSLKESARTQVSMLRQVADLYNLSSYDMVTVNRINKLEEASVVKAVSAEFVTVTIKEQYISRGDMQFFQKSLIGRWIYEGQRLTNSTKGVHAHAREIRHGKRLAKSGIITDETMITFRSRSARIFWLVQISSDMWDYASPYVGEESSCEIYFDKFVTFMHRLFEKWRKLEVTHSLTVVFFSRTYLSSDKVTGPVKKPSSTGREGAPNTSERHGENSSSHVNVDVCGRLYEDHFKTVIENETTTDWDSVIIRIKREFVRYPFDVGWNLSNEHGRRPSTAAQGNILEAVNVTLNLMQFHYLDRDLHRVGNSIVIVSPGCGVFEVDRDLAGITYQRMMDNGIGSDMLSLGLPPLHTAPFFHYNNDLFAVEAHGVDAEKKYHEVPHWMHLSFFSYDNESHSQDFAPPNENRGTTEANSAGRSSHNIEVAANGFYIPNFKSEAEQTLMRLNARRASFSALANVAASPTVASKSQSRQRQLISGRDFHDILEACRPRNSRHSVAPALSSLLRLYEMIQKEKHQCSVVRETVEDAQVDYQEKENSRLKKQSARVQSGSSQLKVWNAIDFDEVAEIFSQSPTTRELRKLQDTDQTSDGSSPTPSFSSQLSNLLSRSFERATPMHSYGSGLQFHTRSMTDGIQIQRSPSIDSLALVDEVDANKSSKGRRSDGSVYGLRIEGTTSSVDEHERSMALKDGTIAAVDYVHPRELPRNDSDKLRDLMKQQDTHFFLRHQAMAEHHRVQHGNTRAGDSPTLRTSSLPSPDIATGASQNAGGLGAALQSYNRDKEPIASDDAQMKRNKSVGKLREMSQFQSPSTLSRSLGPFQGTPSSTQLRRTATISSHGSDAPKNLVTRRGLGQAMKGIGNTSTSVSTGILVASSPPHLHGMSQKNYSPPNDQLRRTATISSRESDAPENLVARRGQGQAMKGIGNRNISLSTKMLVASSPPHLHGMSQKNHSPPNGHDDSPSKRLLASKKPHHSRTRSRTLNPFKQQDEEAVLAEKSHNRRRWSHVFPLGEIEFKRHAGPNWISLSQPAILPLTIDYYPPPQELITFLIRTWDIPLADIERGHYKSHSDLMMEMIRQRITQDYQIVPQSVVQESRRRAEAAAQLVAQDRSRIREDASPSPMARSFLTSPESINLGRVSLLKSQDGKRRSPTDRRQGLPRGEGEIVERNLSMGHTIHVLKYDPNAEEKKIIVEQLSRRRTQDNSFMYKYLLYSTAMKKYVKVVQQFHEFSYEYRWNQVDHLIGGIEDKKRSAEMKFRQLMFALIPERLGDKTEEQNYVDKFRKLLDYLNKLRESDETEGGLDVQIVTSDDERVNPREQVTSVRREAADMMKRLTVQLRKGKRDPYEWLDIAVEPTFDTRRSYRIMIQWLVASSSKVESQVQLIQRRCTQYGLKLISMPQLSISPTIFLNPLNAPFILCIRDKDNADRMDEAILARNFVDDGVHMTKKNFLECIDNADDYYFGWRRRIPARQFVHRSGTLFIRLIRDEKGLVILAGTENRRLIGRDSDLLKTARSAFRQIKDFVDSLPNVNNSPTK